MLARTEFLALLTVVALFAIGLTHQRRSAPPALEAAAAPANCLGPPYLLATFHGGKDKKFMNQVHQFSRNGCEINSQILKSHDRRELRCMALMENGDLIVNNAYKGDSAVMLYDSCGPSNPSRHMIGLVAGSLKDDDSDDNIKYLIHPYGAAVYNNRVYVTDQDTCSITSYHVYDAFKGISNETLVHTFEPCQKIKGVITSEPRGIAFDAKGYFYVAHKQKGIFVFDANNDNSIVATFPCHSCIGVTYDPLTNTIFSGSSKDHQVRQFKAYPSLQLVKHFGKKHVVKHPAGMATFEDKLYVASQATSSIVTFHISTGKLLHVFKTTEDDAIEDLIMSPC